MHRHLSLILLATTIFSAMVSHAGPLSLPPSSPSSSSSPSSYPPLPTSPKSTISTPSTNAILIPRDRQDHLDHPELPYARCFCILRAPWKCWIYNIINTPAEPVWDGVPVIQRLEKKLSQCSRFVRLAKSYSPTPAGQKSGLGSMAMFKIPLHVKSTCVEKALKEATYVRNGVGCIYSRGTDGGHASGNEPY